ncbi:MAG: NUDIX hydrolase [Candidatus Magasanikbacteria bacterium]
MHKKKKTKYAIGVFVTILNDKKEILYIHRADRDLWETPGGGLEPGETPYDAAVREVKEETGYDIEIDRLSGIYIRPHNNGMVFNFVGHVIGGKLKLQKEEVNDCKWFSYDELPRNTSPYKKERIAYVLSGENEVEFKVQDGPPVSELLRQKLI